MAKKPEAPPADDAKKPEAPREPQPAPAPARAVAVARRACRVAYADLEVTYRGGDVETHPPRVDVLRTDPERFDVLEGDADEVELALLARTERLAELRAAASALGFELVPCGDAAALRRARR